MKKALYTLDEFLEIGGIKKDLILLIVSFVFLAICVADNHWHFWPFAFDSALIVVVLCGVPIILEALIGLGTRLDITADVLVAIALIASLIIGEYFAAAEVAFIMQIGSLLEEVTVAHARGGIERLLDLMPQTARLITLDTERIVPVEDLAVGDIIRVLPGESIPVDGIIISGHTSINQAVLTGESLPVDKQTGDEVFSGTLNQFGAFEMRATKVGEDSSVQKMIQLVQSADVDKAKIVRLADRWARWIVIVAVLVALLSWCVTGEVIRAVTVLVVFCPCALVLATPTAIVAAMGNASKHGFLVGQGDALERLSGVSVVSFDKTGTLTHAKPSVKELVSCSNYSVDEIFRFAAAAEQLSEHPLGMAITNSYTDELPRAESFSMQPGLGIRAQVEGAEVIVGTRELLCASQVSLSHETETALALEQGNSISFVAIDGVFAGYIVFCDTVRDEAFTTIQNIKSLGIKALLLTGDDQQIADSIAEQLDIDRVVAHCLPQDKLAVIDDLQKNNDLVCMIGDGINDAPALKKAHCGIAMGGVGSDIAVEAADITLVDDKIKELPHLIALSKKMMRSIKLNIIFSLALNFLAMGLALTGLLGPAVGALVHNLGSMAVIINSSFLLRWKTGKWKREEITSCEEE